MTGRETRCSSGPFAKTIIYEMHVGGLHPPSQFRRRADEARHLCGPDRQNPVSAGSRHYRGRAAAGLCVRRAGWRRRGSAITGVIIPSRSLRRMPATAPDRDPLGAARRVSRHGQGAASRRHRGHPRRRLQSHGRGQRRRPDALLSRIWRTTPTTSSAEDKSRYADYTGCGNTLNANDSVVRRLILDSLRYWVSEMHVDGFRFDLASILSRDEQGRPMASPPVLWDIESDPCSPTSS